MMFKRFLCDIVIVISTWMIGMTLFELAWR